MSGTSKSETRLLSTVLLVWPRTCMHTVDQIVRSNLNVVIADVVDIRVDFDSLSRTWVLTCMLDRCQICTYNIGEG